MATPTRPTIEELAARLLTLKLQSDAIKDEESKIKEELEALHSQGNIPTKQDVHMQFDDGVIRKVRIARQSMGTYFKVGEEFKEDFAKEKKKLESEYLNSGKAVMAAKAAAWKVQTVKD